MINFITIILKVFVLLPRPIHRGQRIYFHFQTLIMRQIWVGQTGIQAAVETRGNDTAQGLQNLGQGMLQVAQIQKLKQIT